MTYGDDRLGPARRPGAPAPERTPILPRPRAGAGPGGIPPPAHQGRQDRSRAGPEHVRQPLRTFTEPAAQTWLLPAQPAITEPWRPVDRSTDLLSNQPRGANAATPQPASPRPRSIAWTGATRPGQRPGPLSSTALASPGPVKAARLEEGTQHGPRRRRAQRAGTPGPSRAAAPARRGPPLVHRGRPPPRHARAAAALRHRPARGHHAVRPGHRYKRRGRRRRGRCRPPLRPRSWGSPAPHRRGPTQAAAPVARRRRRARADLRGRPAARPNLRPEQPGRHWRHPRPVHHRRDGHPRSEEHTPELQSRGHLVCRLLLEKKKQNLLHLHLIKKKKKTYTKNQTQ